MNHLLAGLIALLIYLPIGYAAVIEERREWLEGQPYTSSLVALAKFGYRVGDHRQWKRWR